MQILDPLEEGDESRMTTEVENKVSPQILDNKSLNLTQFNTTM